MLFRIKKDMVQYYFYEIDACAERESRDLGERKIEIVYVIINFVSNCIRYKVIRYGLVLDD